MKYNYTVEVTVYNHVTQKNTYKVTQKNTYKNVEEAMNAAKKSVLDYANTLRKASTRDTELWWRIIGQSSFPLPLLT